MFSVKFPRTCRSFGAFALLLASACTVASQQDAVHADFHPPLVRQHWHIDHYTMPNEAKVCAVSSGGNGITVLLSNRMGTEDVLIQSTRTLGPGATLTANVDGRTYQTYTDYFPTKQSMEVLSHLEKGDTLYLEWSEFSGPTGRERSNVQNIVPLAGFEKYIKQCRDALKL